MTDKDEFPSHPLPIPFPGSRPPGTATLLIFKIGFSFGLAHFQRQGAEFPAQSGCKYSPAGLQDHRAAGLWLCCHHTALPSSSSILLATHSHRVVFPRGEGEGSLALQLEHRASHFRIYSPKRDSKSHHLQLLHILAATLPLSEPPWALPGLLPFLISNDLTSVFWWVWILLLQAVSGLCSFAKVLSHLSSQT